MLNCLTIKPPEGPPVRAKAPQVRAHPLGANLGPAGENGALEILERAEGGCHQVSVCDGPPAILGWATGNLREPPNNPQVGMANMRTLMPALQRAKSTPLATGNLTYQSAAVPKQQRDTRIVKDLPAEEIARELAAWIRG